MGQKVNPNGLRVGVIRDWESKWYADKKDFADMLVEDNEIREFIKKKLYAAGISKVVIERPDKNRTRITVLTARPGMVIGKSGNGIDELKAQLAKKIGKDVDISIQEVRRSELDAQLTAESVAQALERRTSFRRAMKQAIQRTMKAGAKGCKITCSGRLGGAEIARSEKYAEGNVPLHTIRADIDYGFAEADTTYGRIGVKVWINHGEVLDKGLKSAVQEEKPARHDRRRADGKRTGRRDERGERRGSRAGGQRREGSRDRNGRDSRNFIPKAANQRIRAKKAEPAPQEAEAPQTEATETANAEE